MPASDGPSFRNAHSNRPVDEFNISRRTEGQSECPVLSAICLLVSLLTAVTASRVIALAKFVVS
jgi:hypothetical protein